MRPFEPPPPFRDLLGGSPPPPPPPPPGLRPVGGGRLRLHPGGTPGVVWDVVGRDPSRYSVATLCVIAGRLKLEPSAKPSVLFFLAGRSKV